MAPQGPVIAYRAELRALIALWDADRDVRSFQVRADSHHSVPIIIRGLVAHAVDCARAVLVLYESSLPLPAAPVIRVLIEDAVTAGWVLVTPDGWRYFLAGGADQRRKALNALLQDDPTNEQSLARLAELTAMIDDLGRSPQYEIIEQRIASLDGMGQLYQLYRFVTWLSHAGTEVAERYTGPADTAVGVAFRPSASHPTASVLLEVATNSLLQALIAWDCALVDRAHEDELNEIADRLGVRSSWSQGEAT